MTDTRNGILCSLSHKKSIHSQVRSRKDEAGAIQRAVLTLHHENAIKVCCTTMQISIMLNRTLKSDPDGNLGSGTIAEPWIQT